MLCRARSRQYPGEERLRFGLNALQVLGAAEALRVQLVNRLGARRARREPAAGARHLHSPEAGVVTGGAGEDRLDGLASELCGLDVLRRKPEEGGLLLAGPDPTGNGGVIPGFGDQRELELLVEAGFSPVEAIRIGTLNGATYLGLQDRIGSITAGKDADLIVVRGNPAANIDDVEKVDIVFKDGVGFDSMKLIESVKGRFGEY